MRKIVIGALATSLIFFYGLNVADAKGKVTKNIKSKKVVQVDKDRNGIADNWQKKYHLGIGKYIAAKDNDKDGLNNLIEYQLNLNPLSKDTDRDRVSDSQEDNDKDGLTNLQEVQTKMSPLKADTDKDGIKDADEDNDHDQLTTKQEFMLGTNPLNADSDKDGITDDEEDRDGDTLSNALELKLGYNPVNSDSDHDGKLDSDEDVDHDGIPNKNELQKIKIKVEDENGKKFELEYKISKKESISTTKIKDQIGITDASTLINRLTLSPNISQKELIEQVKQALGLNHFAKLEVEVKFGNGKDIESEYEFGDNDFDNNDYENNDEDQGQVTGPVVSETNPNEVNPSNTSNV